MRRRGQPLARSLLLRNALLRCTLDSTSSRPLFQLSPVLRTSNPTYASPIRSVQALSARGTQYTGYYSSAGFARTSSRPFYLPFNTKPPGPESSVTVLLRNNTTASAATSSSPPPPSGGGTVPPLGAGVEGTQQKGQPYVLWLQNIYPVKRYRIDFRELLVGDYEKKIHSVFPPDANITKMERVIKEGGVYVHFETPPGITVQQHAAEMIKYLAEHPRLMFPWARQTPKAFLVRGKPFVEDMQRLPSSRLIIQFRGPDLLVDKLYELFRPYGRIRDIEIPKGQPKDELRTAVLQMERIEDAITARNCLHNKQIDNTMIQIQYDTFQPISYLQNMFAKHPRIMFPVVGLMVTAATYLLFDPLRVGSIYYRRLNKPYTPVSKGFHPTPPTQVNLIQEVTENRQLDLLELDRLFEKEPSSVVIINAPKGTGVSALLKGALLGRRQTLLVECHAHDPEAFVEELCAATAFTPSFRYINTLGNYLDAIIPSSKHFFSSPVAAQLQAILDCLRLALRRASDRIGKEVGEPPVVVFDGFGRMIRSMSDNPDKAQLVMDTLLSWAAEITAKYHYAHVMFVSDDSFAPNVFRKYVEAAGGRLDVFTIDDVQQDIATNFIRKKLNISEEEVRMVTEVLGGRLADLDLFCRKVKSGLSPEAAIGQMRHEAMNIIRNEGLDQKGSFLPPAKDKDKASQPTWLKSQLWETIKKIAHKGTVGYDELLYTTFAGDEKALHALVSANMLRIISNRETNKLEAVTAFSPLYLSAFRKMVKNQKMSAGIGIVVKKFELEQETAKMTKILDELVKLRSLVYRSLLGDTESVAVAERRKMLEFKLQEYNQKLSRLEKELTELGRLQAELKWK